MKYYQSNMFVFILLFFGASNITLSQTWSVSNQWGSTPLVGDFNGDGWDDVASYNGSVVYMKFSNGSGFTNATWSSAISSWSNYTWTGDFNGDGRADIANRVSGRQAGKIYMRLSTGSGFTGQTWNVASTWGGGSYSRSGDFNGDGIDDIASPKNGNVYMKLGTGSGFTSQTWATSNQWCGDTSLFVGDFNGDGYDDLASVCGTTVYMKISTGSGFVSQTWSSDYGGWTNYTWADDFDNDGRTDLATRKSRAEGSTIKILLSTGSSFKYKQGPAGTGEPWNPDWTVENLWGSGAFSVSGNFGGGGGPDGADVASFSGSNAYMKLDYTPTGSGASGGPPPYFSPIYQTYSSSTSFDVVWNAQNANSCLLRVDYEYNFFFYGPYYYNVPPSGSFNISNSGFFNAAYWIMTCQGSGGTVEEDGAYLY